MIQPVILWFRQDLRLRDNPALVAAHETGASIIPVYILDDENAGPWKMGGASRWWLHQSLKKLDEALDGKLCLLKGNAEKIIPALIKETKAQAVHWNRCYEPWRITRDKKIKKTLQDMDIAAKSYNGSLLYEPHTTLKADGTPYKVFTPYYKNGCLGKNGDPDTTLQKPKNIDWKNHKGLKLNDLELMPSIKWYKDMEKTWKPGEEGAQKQFQKFLDDNLKGYALGRDVPRKDHTSRLSPYLHFGEISPRQIWYATKQHMVAEHAESDGFKFLSELVWREFSNNLLFYFQDLPEKNLQQKFDKFPWRKDAKALKRWQKGMTGYPIIDAGMRELWQTGYMHNRVRMITASFLIKNLMLHWHHGEKWFWDTLVDADLANNSASWQWVAGSGADAAPYFRIFNPVTQSQKFDPHGDYIRRYVPELKNLPDKYLHDPSNAPDDVLEEAGIVLDKTYPTAIIDLKETRERALEAYKTL